MSKVISIQGSATALKDSVASVSTEASVQPEIGDFLVATSSTTAEWSTVSTGDISSSNTSANTNELALFDGTTGKLIKNSTVLSTDLLTEDSFIAKGDLISATAAGTSSVLAVGTDGQVLTANSGDPEGLIWTTPTIGNMIGPGFSQADEIMAFANTDGVTTIATGFLYQDLITQADYGTKGDLLAGDGTGAGTLAIGTTDGHVLTVSSSDPTGMVWAQPLTHDLTVRSVASGNTPVVLLDDIINMDSTIGDVNMTLPDTSTAGVLGKSFYFINQSALNLANISTGAAADKIVNGGTEEDSIVLSGSMHERIHLINNGTNYWYVM